MGASPGRRLFCFGLGYVGQALATPLMADGWRVAGTSRDAAGCARLAPAGIDAFVYDGRTPLREFTAALDGTTHLLASIPPDADGDPALRHHAEDLASLGGLAWVGYLSTTGVYGDTGGRWVDEDSPLEPSGERGARRVTAEAQWRDLWWDHGLPVHVFRLAGIYGPGRGPVESVRNGSARRIHKAGQVFSRIHVADIVQVLQASMAAPRPGGIYNVCDDEPAPPDDVVAYACDRLGVEKPALVPYHEAESEMSPMARSFYRDNRRVRNDRIKHELGVTLRYPDYRSGIDALVAAD